MLSDKDKRTLGLLRYTQEPYIMAAVNTALSDPSSNVGAELRRIISHRPGEAYLEHLVPTFASWPAADQQQAIQASRGAVHYLLRSLTKEEMTAEQWRAIGRRCNKTRIRELLTSLTPSDAVLVGLALTDTIRNEGYAHTVADEILDETPAYSPARFTYVAAKEISVRLADIIRDGMNPEDIARHITPKTVSAAWSVLGTPAATDDRVVRWSRWVYEANKDDWWWMRADRIANMGYLMRDPEVMTTFLLGKIAAERQLVCSETEVFRKLYQDAVRLLDEGERYWLEQVTLRVDHSLGAEDLMRFAPKLVWEHDLFSHRQADRVEMLRRWRQACPPEEVLGHLQSDRFGTRVTALAVALALKHYSPQNLSNGGWWGTIRAGVLAREDDVPSELAKLLEDAEIVREFELDPEVIKRKAGYGLGIKKLDADIDDDLDDDDSDTNDQGVVHLRDIDDLTILYALLGWRSRAGRSGRGDHALPELFEPVTVLSEYERHAFQQLLPEWDGDILSLCEAARSLSS
jgi:hypothetical protein